MKVYIVRHGQVLNNALHRHTDPNEDLTKLGVEQAKKLREKIKDKKFDIVYVSPYLRARHTANILNVTGIETIIDERLRERSSGKLQGKPIESDKERKDYWHYYSKNEHEGAENIILFFDRVYKFIDELKSKDYDSVLVVAHSGVSKAFKAYFEGIQDGYFLNKGLKNCEIKEYEL